MTDFSFQGFGAKPAERARIEQVLKELRRSEVGRRFLSSLPPKVTFKYVKGDRFSRANANFITGVIVVPQNTFDSPFATCETIVHELAHQLQTV